MPDDTLLDKFTPKQAFVAGIVLTVLSLGTLGFLWSLVDSQGFDRSAVAEPRPASAAARPSERPDPTPNRALAVRPVDEQDHIRGEEDAPITLIEYSDFECPFCAEFHPTLKRLIAETDEVRWIYRHFPLTSMHPNALQAAEASECAADQGEFWAMADEMFENQSRGLSWPQLVEYANNIGLDLEEFEECVKAGTHVSKVRADASDAEAVGAGGTPFTVVVSYGDRTSISGAVSLAQIRATIDSLR